MVTTRMAVPLVAAVLAASVLIPSPGAAALTPELDGDGDGWANPVETLLGSDAGDPFKTPESFAIPASCLDGADNDGDGATDDADPGCHPRPVITGTFPPAGFDVHESEISLTGFELETPVGTCPLDFEGVGPTVIRRGNPTVLSSGAREIVVEIVALQLTGTATLLPGSPCNPERRVSAVPMTLLEDPSAASPGTVTALEAGNDFPASSSIDLRFVADTPFGVATGTIPLNNPQIDTLPPFHTPNDPAANPDCYESDRAQQLCPKAPLDHFQCYAGDFPPSASVGIRLLLDQFFGGPTLVGTPSLFCSAVGKNRLPVFDAGAHLQFYPLPAEPTPATGAPVVVRNQFGTQTLEVGERVSMAVPTQADGLPAPLALDHFACHDVSGNQLNRPVSLQDRFHASNTVVTEPLLLCNPGAKVHDDQLTRVQDRRWHLVCYEIQPGTFSPVTAATTNQLGAGSITARAPVILCVPSQKFFERFQPRIPVTVGLVDPSQGRWHLRDLAGNQTSFFFGDPGDVPFMGDWDCDGDDTPGLYRQSDGFVYLRNSNTQGVADARFFYGIPGDIPLAGDFNEDGCDTVSIYRPSESRVYVINQLGSEGTGLGPAEFFFDFGNPGDKPVVGDWDGDGVDEIGLHRESTGLFYWRDTLTTGVADDEIFFGDPGDRLAAGDWGVVDGKDTPAVFRPSDRMFYLRDSLTLGIADEAFPFGESHWLPVAGTFGLD